jgi:epoxyqueuosine reductase QueG
MEKTNNLTDAVKEYAIDEIGFDLVQFDKAPEGHHPTNWLPSAKSVVVAGIEVLHAMLSTTPSTLYHKHYDQLNIWLTEAGYQLARFLERKGFEAIYFPESDPYEYFYAQIEQGVQRPSPSFCHIHSAVAAGLGRRGKVGVVLTPQYGPRQRWMTVMTTAELIPDPKFQDELCLEFVKPGSCGDECIKACATNQNGALKPWPDEGGVEMLKCNWATLKSKGLACGQCIQACPVGRAKKK